jgi:hypothetical protein
MFSGFRVYAASLSLSLAVKLSLLLFHENKQKKIR